LPRSATTRRSSGSRRSRSGAGCRANFGQQFDTGFQQIAFANGAFDDPEASAAVGGDHQDAELFHFPVADGGEGANRMGWAAAPTSLPLSIRQMPKGERCFMQAAVMSR
jgi:hypothetical protein